MKSENMKEATLATLKLKDMLGIGDVGKSSERVLELDKVEPNPAIDSNAKTTRESTKKKKKPKLPSNGKSKKTKEHKSRQSKGVSASSSTHQSKQKRTTSKGSGQISHQSHAEVNDKRGRKHKNSTGGQHDNNGLHGNYAWSAFQSPPDASTLPLPVFTNTSSHSSGVSVGSETESQLKGTDGQILSRSTSESNACEPKNPEDVAESGDKGKKSAEALTSEDHIRAILNIEQKLPSNNAINSIEHDTGHDTGANQHDKGAFDQVDVRLKTEPENNSPSGINLATLPSPSPQIYPSNEQPLTNDSPRQLSTFAGDTRTNHNELDPIAMLMNGQSYGSNPHYSYYPAPQQAHTSGYQQQLPMMQQHSHPPQYVTIQVQVPPVLLPGRQMMVSAVPGYSVPIVVPEGIHPGMILPVTIPAHSPSPGQLGGPVSPSMMPHGGMMNLNLGSPSHQNFQHQELRNGQQYAQPQFSSPQQKHRNGLQPGSWAARAAASPPNKGKQTKHVGNN